MAEQLKVVEVLVLDEADRLLEERLLPHMLKITQAMPQLKQALLATATIDEQFEGKRLCRLLGLKLSFEKHSTFSGKKTVSTLIQNYIFTAEHLKCGYLLALLKTNPTLKTIVFIKSCKECTLTFEVLKKL